MGYVITEICEIWHFKKKQDRLFEKYIIKFLKIKTEASGWPTGVGTMQQKSQYTSKYLEKEKNPLDQEKVEKSLNCVV